MASLFLGNKDMFESFKRLDFWHIQTADIGVTKVSFFIFCFTDFFRNKLGAEDEIKIKFVRTIFQLNSFRPFSN